MDPFRHILGQSPAVEAIQQFGRRAADVNAPVLLTGESGTGKGLLARAIHQASSRSRRRLVAVNCASVPEGLFENEFFGHTRGAYTGAASMHRGVFEQANGGTLFLDEIGELPSALQAKLLTSLESGMVRRLGAEREISVDVRVIAATGMNLRGAVRDRRFRRDLYHRLLVLSMKLPPLRERPGDVDFLAAHFLEKYARKYDRPISGFAAPALSRLHRHGWPGNVRELAHAIEAAVLSCESSRVSSSDLPATVGASRPDSNDPMDPEQPGGRSVSRRYSFYGSAEEERRMIRDVMAKCNGNKTRAARRLGMARTTLRSKLRRLEVDDSTEVPSAE